MRTTNVNSNTLTAILSVLTIATTLGYHRESRGSTGLASRVEKLELICKQQDAILISLTNENNVSRVMSAYDRSLIEGLQGDKDEEMRNRRLSSSLSEDYDKFMSRIYKPAVENGMHETCVLWEQRIQTEWHN